MKRFLSVVTLLMVMVACQKELQDSELSQNEFNLQNVPELIPETRTVSSEQAFVFGNIAFSAINTAESVPFITLEAKREVKEVIPILDDSDNVVMYLLNSTSNNGYLLISADKEATQRILAFGESGNLDITSIEPISPFGTMLKEQKAKISSEIAQGIHIDNSGYELWESIEAENFEIEIQLCKDAPETKGRHTTQSGRTDIACNWAVYNCLWGQGTGYNADAPMPNYDLVGCPAVAIGILCRANYYPYQFDYFDMPTTLNTTSSNAISRMFRSIGNAIPNYKWSHTNSGASGPNIVTGLHNLGYTQAKQSVYSLGVAYDSFEDGYPVLLGGSDSRGSHIWIASGYWQAVWKVTKKFLGIKLKTWYEYQDNIYMNWGWDGDQNGWIDNESWPNFNNQRQIWHRLNPSY